jgi:hypothetical protein
VQSSNELNFNRGRSWTLTVKRTGTAKVTPVRASMAALARAQLASSHSLITEFPLTDQRLTISPTGLANTYIVPLTVVLLLAQFRDPSPEHDPLRHARWADQR